MGVDVEDGVGPDSLHPGGGGAVGTRRVAAEMQDSQWLRGYLELWSERRGEGSGGRDKRRTESPLLLWAGRWPVAPAADLGRG